MIVSTISYDNMIITKSKEKLNISFLINQNLLDYHHFHYILITISFLSFLFLSSVINNNGTEIHLMLYREHA